MTLVEALQNKLQSWKESISSCTEAEGDEQGRKTYVSASCSLHISGRWVFIFTLGDFSVIMH